MVVKVIDLLSNNMVRATGNDWYELYKKVLNIRKEVGPEEELVLDFNKVDVRFESDTIYATDIAVMPNLKIIVYNNVEVAAALQVAALMSGKSEDSVENVVVEVKSLTVAPPSEKELRNRAETDKFLKWLRNIFVFNGTLRVNMQGLNRTDIPSIRSLDRGVNFRKALRTAIEEFNADGKGIDRVIVNTAGYDMASHVKDALADESTAYSLIGIKLSVLSSDKEENRKLKLRTDIGKKELPVEDKYTLLKNLGRGTVGVLTKFKKRKSQNIELRLEDTITNQYIAILHDASLKTGMAKFICYKYSELVSKWDEYASCGDILDTPASYEKEISLAEMGLEHACIGTTWHFNRFDGAAEGERTRNTWTSADGSYAGECEEVLIPEYIRRALLSYDIKFNNKKLIKNVEEFKRDMEEALKE